MTFSLVLFATFKAKFRFEDVQCDDIHGYCCCRTVDTVPTEYNVYNAVSVRFGVHACSWKLF